MNEDADRTNRRTSRAYVRALEAALARVLDRPVILSHRDWDLARRWHDQGVPLGLVVETLEERGARAGRGLGSIASQVAEAWQVVQSGRQRGTGARAVGPGFDPPGEALRAAVRSLPDGELASALVAIAADLPREGPLRRVERRVDEAIENHAPREWWAEALAEARTELAPFRGRMPPDRLDATARRGAIERIRRRLGIERARR